MFLQNMILLYLEVLEKVFLSETGSYTPPPLEGQIASDTLTPSSAPVACQILGPMGGGFLCTTGAETENSAVNLQKSQYRRWIKVRRPLFPPVPVT